MKIRRLAPLAMLFLAWTLASRFVGPMQLPGPLRTFRLLIATAAHSELILAQGGGAHGFAPHVLSTFLHVALAGTTGVVLGLLFVSLVSIHPVAQSLGDAAVDLGRTLPPLLLVPFASAILGVSDWVRLLVLGFYAALTTSVYAAHAFRSVPAQYSEMAGLLGASRVRNVLTVTLPASLPHLLGPLRWTFSFALGISIVVEYLVADKGIGRVMKEVGAYSRADLIVVGVVWTMILAFLFEALLLRTFSGSLDWAERKDMVRWFSQDVSSAERPILH